MFNPNPIPIVAPVSTDSVALTSRSLRTVITLTQIIAWFVLRIVMIFYVKKKRVALVRQDLRNGRPVVIAANHQRAMDPFFILASFPLSCFASLTPYRFFAKNSLYRYRFFRPILFFLGSFPAYHHNSLAYGLNAAEWFIEDGQTIFIFPEGKRMRRKHGNPRPHSGVAVLAADTDCDIIPAKISWRGLRCSVLVGKPVPGRHMSATQIMEAIYHLK